MSVLERHKLIFWKSHLGFQLAYNIYFGLGLVTFTLIEKAEFSTSDWNRIMVGDLLFKIFMTGRMEFFISSF